MKTLRELLGFNSKKSVSKPIGLEIEVEGDNLPNRLENWRCTQDGSLRGNSIEYVLRTPMTYKGVVGALAELKGQYKETGARVRQSVRAGVHVHINVQDLGIVGLYNFVTLCILFEEVLAKFCGKSRVGNLFCLRTKDAGYLLKVLQDVAQTGNLNLFYDDSIRYAFFNMKAVIEHGSLEFRAMRSTTDFGDIKNWIKILMRLKEASQEFKNPEEIIQGFSDGDSEDFRRAILQDYYDLLDFKDSEELIFNGMRNAQDIAYSANWSVLDKIGCGNPFGKVKTRDARTGEVNRYLFPSTSVKQPKLKKIPAGYGRKKSRGGTRLEMPVAMAVGEL